MAAVGEERDEWCEGAIIVDRVLGDQAAAAARRIAALVGPDAAPAAQPPRSMTEAEALLQDAAADVSALLVDEDPERRLQAAELLNDLHRVSSDLREAAVEQRIRAFARVQASIARLRSVGRVDQMLRMVVAEVCSIGFDRAMFTRVEGGRGFVEAFHVVGDPGSAAEILEAGRAVPFDLDHTMLETEMVRRRGPVLVVDAQNDKRVHSELAAASLARCYVAAPIMPDGRVVGFLHADCHIQRRIVDEFDRDLLWQFAEGFCAAYERTMLLERLAALRQEVRRANHSILAVMDEFCDAEVEVARIDRENHSVAHSAAAIFTHADSRLEQLLTKRELDVIKLMSAGETNAGIAMKLVVSEGTVKSHVKHILRKLRASNRAEAVSRYVRLTQQHAQGRQ